MKKIYLLSTLLLIVATTFGQGIRFERGTLAQAIKKAKTEKKVVFVDTYAVWCGPCKWMDATTFKDPEVGKYFDEHLVAIQIDVERGEGPDVKLKYGVEGLPGYIFIDGDGIVVFRGSGSMPPKKFLELAKTGYASASDVNSLGRLAVRFDKEKNDEAFLSLYLDRLVKSSSRGYCDVLEQYLKVQKTIKNSSPEMARFLALHAKALIFGGEAERIIEENFKTEGWRQVVRKEIREIYQTLPRFMAEQTAEYGIKLRDTSYIDIAMRGAEAKGMPQAKGQRDRLLLQYYQGVGDGEKYKKYQLPEIEAFYNTLDINKLREAHQTVILQMEKQPEINMRSYAEIHSEKLAYMAGQFAKFATSDAEKSLVLKWAKCIYDLLPEKVENVAFYANTLYLYGDKQQGMKLKEKVLTMKMEEKKAETQRAELEDMKAGRVFDL